LRTGWGTVSDRAPAPAALRLVQRFVIIDPNPGTGSTLSTLTFVVVLVVGMIFVSMLGRDLVLGTTEE
jgi:multiple sugar transport system permease protein